MFYIFSRLSNRTVYTYTVRILTFLMWSLEIIVKFHARSTKSIPK